MASIQEAYAHANRVHQAGDLRQADAIYRQILQADPGHADAMHYVGVIAMQSGQAERAVEIINRSIAMRPGTAAYYNNLGSAYQMLRRFDEAIAAHEKAAELQPENPDFISGLAYACYLKGDISRAEELCLTGLRLKPDHPELWNTQGNIRRIQGRMDEAANMFRKTVQFNPRHAVAHNNLACTLQILRRPEEAIDRFRAAEALDPNDSRSVSNLLLCMNYDPKIDTPTLFAEHLRWASRFGQASNVGPLPGHDRDPDRRLRIGYVSPHLCSHPLVQFFEPILTRHDPGEVEVICYSEMPSPDSTTARLKSESPGWRDIFGQSDLDLANMIRSDRIDILVDLAGHTSRGRIQMFAHKPAPVQVNYLGYPYTSGLSTMDYRLTDSISDPPGEPVTYTEELIRLPGGFCCFDPGEDT